MSEVELKIKIDGHEVEVRGKKEDVIELLAKAIDYISQFREKAAPKEVGGREEEEYEAELTDIPPPFEITSKDAMTTILKKLFSTTWASKPRTLKEVLNALASMGLHYPKSTIAVSLARLVKKNVIRRMKSRENIYLYMPLIPPRPEEIKETL